MTTESEVKALQTACLICESGAVLERYKHLVFDQDQVRVFNGIVSLQAPFSAGAERFAVNEERLARALAACAGEGLIVSQTAEFLVFKRNKLTIRVRKLDADPVFNESIPMPKKAQRVPAKELLPALSLVAPFVSEDASRPWSVAALVKDGYVWATNNLALVRTPFAASSSFRIPLPALQVLLALESFDWIAHEEQRVVVGAGDMLIAFPESSGEWPDVSKFFATKPKRLDKLDAELLVAAKTIEKFADRFVTLSPEMMQGKTTTMESEYEVAVKKGAGTYSARLLSLVLSVATHGDFSTYPKPVFFAGDGIEGVAVGVNPEQGAA